MENDTFMKMTGVLAVPGEYEKDGKVYIKTAAELKDAAERFPILPITFGHTTSSEPPSPAQQIGTVSQKWSEKEQKVIASFWFDKKKLPETLRSRALDGKKIPISAWYLADSMDEDGTLHGLAYSHVAALEGEDPVCPLDKCGAFVVAESKTSQRLKFTERLEDLDATPTPQQEEAPVESTPEEPDEAPEVEVSEAPKTEPSVVQKQTEPDVPEPAPEVQLEPETPIPVEAPEGAEALRGGRWRV